MEREYIARFKVGYRKDELDGLVADDICEADGMARKILSRKYPTSKFYVIMIYPKEMFNSETRQEVNA